MAIKKNFVVKHGLEVATDVLLVSEENKNIGIGSTIPQYTLDVRGSIGSTDLYVSGFGTIVNLSVGSLSISTITGVLNFDAGVGTITTFDSTNGTITNLSGTAGTITTFDSSVGIISNFSSFIGTITTFDSSVGIITNFSSSIGTITTFDSTNLSGTAGTITTFDSTNGTITNLSGTAGTITTFDSTNGTITNLSGTDLNYSGISTFNNIDIDGTITAGSSEGANGQYLRHTGTGVTWATLQSSVVETDTQTASEGQTVFNTDYTVGLVEVYLNGVRLSGGEFTATDGSTITLSSGAFDGDTLDFVSYNPFNEYPTFFWQSGEGQEIYYDYNVGIGTTNPTTKLQVGSTFNPQVIGFGTVLGYAYPSTNVLIGDENTGPNLTPKVGGDWKGLNNNFIGAGAGKSTTTGSGNNFFGLNAGCSNTSGYYNNFFGLYSGCSNTEGSNNNFFGSYKTGLNNTTGSYNNFFGYYAGYYNTSGSNNNFLGRESGCNNTTGCHNNFLGRESGCNNTTGGYNNFFGQLAGYGNTSGNNNNMFGLFAGVDNTTGSCNNFFGRNVASNNTTGCNNIIIGEYAGYLNTTGNHNTFLGSFTGISNTASNKVIFGRGFSTNFLFDSPNTTSDAQFAVGIRTSTAASKYWLVGDENFNIGINSTAPTAKLDVIGDVRVGIDTSQGVILTSPNGTKYRLIVDDSGTLSTISI